MRQTRLTGLPSIGVERDAILAISKHQHPNIINVIDIWTEQEAFRTAIYIQMELCHGDLHGFLSRHYDQEDPEPLPETDIWAIFKQLMSGIKFIHSQGIIHRDLKPKNGTSSHYMSNFSSLYSQ